MRTTLTLDNDVAALLEKERRKTGASFKELINEVLRRGLNQPAASSKKSKPFRTGTHDGGRCLLPSLDSISEVLAIIEGEDHK